MDWGTFLKTALIVDIGFGVAIGSICVVHSLIRYVAYVARIEQGVFSGDPTDGKMWFSWILSAACCVPLFNLFPIWVIVSSFYETSSRKRN